MEPSLTLNPEQFAQILNILQEISSKLDSLQPVNTDVLSNMANKVMDNMLTYHMLTR